MGEGGAAVVRPLLDGRVAHVVVSALGIAPDVAEVEPVADLVGGGTAFIVGGLRGAPTPKVAIINHDAIGSRRSSIRKLRIT
jgi:hypothetical protein